jgi:hypothetical protein
VSGEEADHEKMVEAIREARGEPPPANPPPGPKWQAEAGLNRMNLNGAEHDVMACLIDRASTTIGHCYPSEEFIAGWTNRAHRTVERAIGTLKAMGLIRVIGRGTKSNLYLVNWAPCFAAYHALKEFERGNKAKNRRRNDARKASRAKSGGSKRDCPARSGGSDPPKVADKPTYRTSEDINLRPKRVLAHAGEALDRDFNEMFWRQRGGKPKG